MKTVLVLCEQRSHDKNSEREKTKESGNHSSAFWSSVCAKMDNKNVTMILTYHGDKQEKGKQHNKKKKKHLLDLYQSMTRVDLQVQVLHPQTLERKKVTKW